jgi:hypothetical protein
MAGTPAAALAALALLVKQASSAPCAEAVPEASNQAQPARHTATVPRTGIAAVPAVPLEDRRMEHRKGNRGVNAITADRGIPVPARLRWGAERPVQRYPHERWLLAPSFRHHVAHIPPPIFARTPQYTQNIRIRSGGAAGFCSIRVPRGGLGGILWIVRRSPLRRLITSVLGVRRRTAASLSFAI